MIIPCQEMPDNETTDLLLRCGIDVLKSFKQYKGVYGFEVTNTNKRLAYKRQHSEYITYITVEYNGYKIIESFYKYAFYDMRAHLSVCKENIATALSVTFEGLPREDWVKTPLQNKIQDSLFALFELISTDRIYGGSGTHLPSILYRLKQLRLQSFSEHDKLIYSNDYYLYLFKLFPNWSDNGMVEEINRRMNSPAAGLWAFAVVFPDNPWKSFIADCNTIPIQLSDWNYDEDTINYPHDPFSMITATEIRTLVLEYADKCIDSNLNSPIESQKDQLLISEDLILDTIESINSTPISGQEIFFDNRSQELLALASSSVERTKDEFRKLFVCPITMTYYVRPFIANDGETYSQHELLKLMARGSLPEHVPQYNRVLASIFIAIKEKNNLLEQIENERNEVLKSEIASRNEFSGLKLVFFSSTSSKEDHKNLFLRKYNLTDNPSDTALEKGLRNAANKGRWQDLQVFISDYNVNVNAKDDSQHKRTALHWAVIQANTASLNKLADYKECIKILLNSNARLDIQDGYNKTVEAYDTKKIVNQHSLDSQESRSTITYS